MISIIPFWKQYTFIKYFLPILTYRKSPLEQGLEPINSKAPVYGLYE